MIPITLPLAGVHRQAASPPILLSWREGQLCAPVKIGDGTFWFLLDTGCGQSFLTRRALARLTAAGAKSAADGTLTLDDVRIGGFSVGTVQFDEEDPAAPVDGSFDGYLGADLLERYEVGLDLRERTLRLWPAGTKPEGWFTAPPEALLKVPFTERNEGWCVPVEVGNLTVPMVLDTGASATFLHTDVAAYLKGARKTKGIPPSAPFYDGLHQVRTYTIPSVGMAGLSFGERTVGVASVSRMVGLLGRDLLSPLKILLDYGGGTATFAGAIGDPLPIFGGPSVTLPDGVVVHWPRGVVANAPPGCAYVLPPGYREVFNRDESISLVPPKGEVAPKAP